MEKTLSIVKPDAMGRNLIGTLVQDIEGAAMRIAAMKMVHLQEDQAKAFYAEHAEKPFFGSLVAYMTTAPVVLMVVEGENAISKLRTLMGATDPAEAEKGTIRERFGESIERNCLHGSDSPASAEREIGLFFAEQEIF